MKIQLPLLLLVLLTACAASRHGQQAPAPPASRVELVINGLVKPFEQARVSSVDDANQRFQIHFAVQGAIEADSAMPVLVLGERRITANSYGSSADDYECLFEVGRADAESLSAALDVELTERAPWTARLSGSLEPVGELNTRAEHLPLRFTLTNSGPVAVWFLDGGRGRNELGRDNRFELEVKLDGTPLALRELHDFGGLGIYRRLEPGQSHTLEFDLAHWCRLDRAGEYAITVSYLAELMPAQFTPGATLPMGGYAHLTRGVAVPAQTVLTVR